MKEVNPETTTRAYAFKNVDECPDANGNILQNTQRVKSHKNQ